MTSILTGQTPALARQNLVSRPWKKASPHFGRPLERKQVSPESVWISDRKEFISEFKREALQLMESSESHHLEIAVTRAAERRLERQRLLSRK